MNEPRRQTEPIIDGSPQYWMYPDTGCEVAPCVLAGTSERGVCSACGKPWERVVEKTPSGQTQKMPDGFATYEGAHGSIHSDGQEAGVGGKQV